MKKLVALVLICAAFSCTAQQKERSEKILQKITKADQLFNDAYYEEAIEAYREIVSFESDNTDAQLRIAESYLKLQNTQEARREYKQSLDKADLKIPVSFAPYHLYNYAEILLSDGQTEDALRWFELYKQAYPADSRSDRKIEGICQLEKLKTNDAGHEIEPLAVNSKFPDFSPAFYEDGLVFVSGRTEEAKSNTQTFLDLYFTSLQSEGAAPQKFSDVINTDFHEGPAVFYENNRKVLFTRNNLNGKLKSSEEKVIIHLQIFQSEKNSDGTWKAPALISINNKDYSIGHPAISTDGQHLYFSSNMPGGLGGTDLYVSDWLNNAWSKPENLGEAINTEGNEMFPFLQGDTVLYFASNGHAGFGGLDVYRFSPLRNNVENLGYPVNSPKDDFGLILNAIGDTGYFSSNRNAEPLSRNDDIYRIKFKAPKKEPEPVAIQEPENRPVEIYYTVQILALKNPITVRRSFLRDLKGVLKHDGKDGFHRYTYGKYNTLEEAVQILDIIKARGYTDAFIRKEERYKELSKRPGVAVSGK
jgi:hypothetical protein